MRQYAIAATVVVSVLALAGCDLGAPPTTYAAPGEVVGTADVDGDGDLDIVTSGDEENFGVLSGDGNGAFSPASLFPLADPCEDQPPQVTCSGPEVRSIGDVNGDGVQDVIMKSELFWDDPELGFRKQEYTVRLGDGIGGFGPDIPAMTLDSSPANTCFPRFTFEDVTEDEIVDAVFLGVETCGFQPSVVVSPGTGTGTFDTGIISPALPSGSYSEATVAEVTGDGHADVLVPGLCIRAGSDDAWTGCIHVTAGDGAGNFAPTATLVAGSDLVDELRGPAVGDVDGDGSVDLVVGNAAAPGHPGPQVGSISIFFGNGAGGFGPEVSIRSATETHRVALADFDVDAHLDVWATVSTDALGHLRFGDGSGGFSGFHFVPKEGQVADLDADGKPDIVTSRAEGIEVFLNRWHGRPNSHDLQI